MAYKLQASIGELENSGRATNLAHEETERSMPTGKVKWFNVDKGYGFIGPDDGGPDVFVHITAIERSGLGSLREGQSVGYEVEPDRRGKIAAVNLREV